MSNPQSFSSKNPQTTLQFSSKQPTENWRTCKATKAKGRQSSAPALFGDMQLLKAMFAYEKHEHRILMTCSTYSLQIQHRAAWFNTRTFKLSVEPVVIIYLKMSGEKKKKSSFWSLGILMKTVEDDTTNALYHENSRNM